MKKNILLIATGAMLFGSCVTFGKYEALESNHTQLRRDFNAVQGELNAVRDELGLDYTFPWEEGYKGYESDYVPSAHIERK